MLIHGVGLRSEAWAAMLPQLSETLHVFAVDLPGHGQSAPVLEEGLDAYVNRFARFVAEFEGPVAVAGHSMGAMIALELAFLLPEKVSAVAALNAIYRRSAEAKQAVLERARTLRGTLPFDPAETLDRWFGTRPVGSEGSAARACSRWLRSSAAGGYATAYTVFAKYDGPANADLEAMEMPSLFITGSCDPNSTPAMSRSMASLVPLGEARIIAGAAHMTPMTHASEAAVPLIATLTRRQNR